jgi:50S ribosomal protein L16 3-hydroxylase
VPAVAALLEPFRFIPNWRVDDLMVSYAAHGGGVGPHFDQYDVFLIQGSGRRRWQIEEMCNAATRLAPHDELRLLANFEPTQEWILEPGDILYLPPGVAHNGTAIGDDCMTYSVGFRAPARSELIAHWCDQVLAELHEDDRYRDPVLAKQDNPGEITPEALARLHTMALGMLEDRAGFRRWFGEYTTVPKYPDVDWTPSEPLTIEEVKAALSAGLRLCRNPASRFAFSRIDASTVLLFVDGHSFDCAGTAAQFADALCREEWLDAESLPGDSGQVADLVLALCNRGSVAFDE